MKTKTLLLLTAILLLAPTNPVMAQTPDLPVYTVQPGDTLYTIAVQFNVTIDDILAVNSFANPDWLSEGDKIQIPGYDGIRGEFIPYTVGLTDTYQSLIDKTIIDEADFIKINQITSPNELIAGKNIILPVTTADQVDTAASPDRFNSAFLELSVDNANVWDSDIENIISTLIQRESIDIQNLSVSPFPFQQGKTSFIHFDSSPDQTLQFLIDSVPVPVFEYAPGKYFAMYGLNALSETGQREIILQSLSGEQASVIYSQNILARDSAYSTDPVIVVEDNFIDPEKTTPEENEMFALGSNVTDRDLWDGSFSYPVDEPCFRSPYGSIRSYNHGPYDAFHTGIDFGICADNLNIYASGSGRIVHAGEWFVRGNSVIIDHGWGIFTGYWHMQSINVQVGDIVDEGQIIGIIGTTGRSTGSHLHWEVLVNDVQVDPLQWIDISIP